VKSEAPTAPPQPVLREEPAPAAPVDTAAIWPAVIQRVRKERPLIGNNIAHTVLLEIKGEPLFTDVFRYIGASPQPLVGHVDRVAHVQTRLEAVPGLHVIGNAYDGVGIPDCVRLAERAAARIV
jgi:hypothetical protein